MNRLIILFKLALATIPFYIFNYLLYYTFNHIPVWVSILINLILLGGIIYYIYSTRKKILAEEQDEDYIPDYLGKSSYFFIVFGAIIALYLSSATFRTTIYIDNGKSVPVKVSISEEGTKTVPANNFIEISAPIGENEIIIDGKKKIINIKDKGQWVYNIDNLNSYIETTVDYSNPDVLYKDNPNDSAKADYPENKIIHKEFFKLESTYIFEAPESITVQKESQNSGVETRTVLYRLPKKISEISIQKKLHN